MMQIRYLGGNITQPIEISCGKMDVKSKKKERFSLKFDFSIFYVIFFSKKDSKKIFTLWCVRVNHTFNPHQINIPIQLVILLLHRLIWLIVHHPLSVHQMVLNVSYHLAITID